LVQAILLAAVSLILNISSTVTCSNKHLGKFSASVIVEGLMLEIVLLFYNGEFDKLTIAGKLINPLLY
jgi:hypothetical protein